MSEYVAKASFNHSNGKLLNCIALTWMQVIGLLLQSNSTKAVVKNSFSILGIIIIGCALGFWGGWEYGRSLGYTGSESIGTLMLALFGFVFGGVLASIIGVIIVSKNK